MALHGRRDLPLAPSPRTGFEMSLLRMLAFRPAEGEGARVPATPASSRGETPHMTTTAAPAGMSAAAAAREALARETPPREASPREASPREPMPRESVPSSPMPGPARAAPPITTTVPAPPVEQPVPAARTASAAIADDDAWHGLVANSGLRGPARLLAEHSVFIGYDGSVLRLSLPAVDEHLKSTALITMVANALVPALGAAPQIRFENASVQGESLRERNERARDERQSAAESAFMSDPDVQRLITQHGAKLVPDSIRPFDDN
jgi:DNA polymerase-3 subunit gamma/tau